MNIEIINRIRRITIIALASDDELIETIVLKGGNAIDLAYRTNNSQISRTSYDLDFSIEDGDFVEDEKVVGERIKKTLEKTFLENGYVIFDFKFGHRPKEIKKEVAAFWGGYNCTFKVQEKSKYDLLKNDIENLRKSAIPLRPDRSPVFELEFSKFEYVGEKAEIKVDGYTIYVYTPEMIAFEKLRAICQQLPQYSEIIKSHSSRARARDFYDIYLIIEMHQIDPSTAESKELITNIFAAKKVSLGFIKEIRNYKALHSDDWNNVQHTVPASAELREFDFYFNYVLERFESITFP